MTNSCNIHGCQSDKAYAIINPKTNRLHRISFSKSLLEHIAKSGDYEVREIKFSQGKILSPGETSSTGLYGIIKSKSGWTLRISLMKDVANYLCDFDSRKLCEIKITKIN